MAEVMFRALTQQAGLGELIRIDSAGTGEWHVGEQADPRTRAALQRVGYSGERHRAKQFDPDRFDDYDLIITFDRGQQRALRAWADNDEQRSVITPLLSFHPDPDAGEEVPDPYYGDDALFDDVRDLIEGACRGLLEQLEPVVRQAAREAADAEKTPNPNPAHQ